MFFLYLNVDCDLVKTAFYHWKVVYPEYSPSVICLGHVFEKGDRTVKDEKHAVELYVRTARLSCVPAHAPLAQCF